MFKMALFSVVTEHFYMSDWVGLTIQVKLRSYSSCPWWYHFSGGKTCYSLVAMLIYQLGLHFIVFQAWWWSTMFYSSQRSGRHVHRWHVGKSPDVNGLAQTISPQNICMWIWTHQIIIPTTTTSSGSIIIMILILIIVIIKFNAFSCRTTLSHSLPVVSPVNFMDQKNGPTWIYQHQIWSIWNKLCCFCWHSNFEPPFSQHLSTRRRLPPTQQTYSKPSPPQSLR